MVDSDLALQRVLEHLSPEAEARTATPDWASVLGRLSAPRHYKRDHRWRFAFAAAVALLAICLPAIALSASVRGWLGFGSQPVYKKARLVVSAPIAGNRVARLWVGPSTDGGECEIITITAASFVAIDPTTGKMIPVAARTRDSGGYGCTVGSTRVPPTALTWIFSPVPVGNTHAALIHGHVGQTYKAVRVDVVWNGGREKLRTVDGYFIGVVAMIRNPVFNRLPYTVVAYNAQGHAVARQRIPTSFLYTKWKTLEPRLRQYRQEHGCSKTPPRLWVCRTR
jgi:hypothetical protein